MQLLSSYDLIFSKVYLLWEVLHDVIEVLFTEEMFLYPVFLSSEVFWMRVCTTQHLNIIL